MRDLTTIAERTLTLAGYNMGFRKYSARPEKKSQGREAGKKESQPVFTGSFNSVPFHYIAKINHYFQLLF